MPPCLLTHDLHAAHVHLSPQIPREQYQQGFHHNNWHQGGGGGDYNNGFGGGYGGGRGGGYGGNFSRQVLWWWMRWLWQLEVEALDAVVGAAGGGG